MTNKFLNVLNKLGFIKGASTYGIINYFNPINKNTIVSLHLHPINEKIINWRLQKSEKILKGQSAKELLEVLLNNNGSGKFRKMSLGGQELIFEDLDQYDNNIERAIAEIFKLEEQMVKKIVSELKFEEYLNLAMALDQENISLAEKILQRYGVKSNRKDIPLRSTPESVVEHINYLTKNNEDNIVTPEFKQLNIFEQEKVLDTLLISQLQKMLANLRGYSEAGMYENALFNKMLIDEIILKIGLEDIFREAIPNAPNKPNNATDDERLEKDTEVVVTNTTNDETEDGTVINDTGNMVTVQTKTGRKTVKKDELMQPVIDEDSKDWPDPLRRAMAAAKPKRDKDPKDWPDPLRRAMAAAKPKRDKDPNAWPDELGRAMAAAKPKRDKRGSNKDIWDKNVDENIIDIKRYKELAGLEIKEEELTEDESMGDNFTLEIDGEEIKKSDDSEELIAYGREYFSGKEWTIFDSETGDIAADWEGEGYLQDAAKSSKFRMGKEPGWEREEKLKRVSEPEQEPTDDWIDDYVEEEWITDEEAKILANRVMMAIGENWPDADPTDVAIEVIKKALGMTKPAQHGYPAVGSAYQSATLFDTQKGEKIFNKVRDAFIKEFNGNFNQYFDELTQQMQADNPGKYEHVPRLNR